ncbi:hypothetical protein HD806DRAFT_530053 [Xylariaceae sp. AK1471]|nr:hypothetical protein HD806DRAFT_530053 [Xylariaceae sp. AK1471]
MLEIAKKCISRKAFNPYNQAKRDKYATTHRVFDRIDSDIVIVLDKNNHVVAFQCSNAFEKLLDPFIQRKVVRAYEIYNCRNPDNNPRKAKPGVYYYDEHFPATDSGGKNVPNPTRDSAARLGANTWVNIQLDKLMYSAVGARTKLMRFFFALLDPQLVEEHVKAVDEISKHHLIDFETRRETGDMFCMKSILINLMINENQDFSYWKNGLTGLVPASDFKEGGDLVLRELGLQFATPLAVSSSSAHQGPRTPAFDHQVQGTPFRDRSICQRGVDDCLSHPLEDIEPEDQVVVPEEEPERFVDERYDNYDLDLMAVESSLKSLPPFPPRSVRQQRLPSVGSGEEGGDEAETAH